MKLEANNDIKLRKMLLKNPEKFDIIINKIKHIFSHYIISNNRYHVPLTEGGYSAYELQAELKNPTIMKELEQKSLEIYRTKLKNGQLYELLEYEQQIRQHSDELHHMIYFERNFDILEDFCELLRRNLL